MNRFSSLGIHYFISAELPFKASMNTCLCFDYVKKSTLCESSVEEVLIVSDLKKIQ